MTGDSRNIFKDIICPGFLPTHIAYWETKAILAGLIAESFETVVDVQSENGCIAVLFAKSPVPGYAFDGDMVPIPNVVYIGTFAQRWKCRRVAKLNHCQVLIRGRTALAKQVKGRTLIVAEQDPGIGGVTLLTRQGGKWVVVRPS